MKELLTIFALTVLSTSAIADQLVFSQDDGEGNWNNVYIDVEDASQFPGAYIPGHRGSSSGGVKAKPAVKGRAASITFTAGPGDSITYTKQPKGGKWRENGYRRPYNLKEIHGSNKGADVTETPGVEAQDAVAEVKPSREEPSEARTIIPVPKGEDMQTFIAEYLKNFSIIITGM